MDVFELRRKLINDYGEYATSFVNIADDRVREHVDEELEGGLLWPQPLIQLNPAFESGATSSWSPPASSEAPDASTHHEVNSPPDSSSSQSRAPLGGVHHLRLDTTLRA